MAALGKNEHDSPVVVSGWDKWDKVKFLPENERETLARVAKEAVGIIPLSDSRLFVLLKPKEMYVFSERFVQHLGTMVIDRVPRDFALHSGASVIAIENTILASGQYTEFDGYSTVARNAFVSCRFETLGKWKKSSFLHTPVSSDRRYVSSSASWPLRDKTEKTPVGSCANKHSMCCIYETKEATKCLIAQFGTQKQFTKVLTVRMISSATDFVSITMTSENVLISVDTGKKPCSGLYMVRIEDIVQQESTSNIAVVTAIMAFPFKMSSIITIQERVYCFGGIDGNMQPVSDVLEYSCERQSWKEVGYMRTSRFRTIMGYHPKQQCVIVAFGNFAVSCPHIPELKRLCSPNISYAVEKCSLQFGI